TPDLLQEVDMEESAAKLAVGNGFKAHVFLELDDLGNGLVFDFAQLLGIDLALGELRTRIQQILWTQEAADLVGAIYLRCGHGDSGKKGRKGRRLPAAAG